MHTIVYSVYQNFLLVDMERSVIWITSDMPAKKESGFNTFRLWGICSDASYQGTTIALCVLHHKQWKFSKMLDETWKGYSRLHSTWQLMACCSQPLHFLRAPFCQKFYNLKISLTHWKLLVIFFKSLEKKLPLEGIFITHNIIFWFVLLSNFFIKYLGMQQCQVVLNAPNFPCSLFLLIAYYNVCFFGAYCVT